MAVTYLANHMVNVWGVVDGNPSLVTTAGATATAPCTAGLPDGGTQTFANCTTSRISGVRSASRTRRWDSTTGMWIT